MEQHHGLLAKKDLVTIGFVTLITVFAWIGFEVYRTNSKDTLPEKTKELIAPLNPTIKQEVIEKLEAARP